MPSLDLELSGCLVSVAPLPLGFHRRWLERGLVPPSPPRQLVRDSRGQAVRDDRGLAVLQEQPADGRFLAAKAAYEERLAAVMIAETVTGIDAIEAVGDLESIRSVGDDPSGAAAYADAVLAALAGAGLTTGDFAALCRAIGQASGLLAAAHEDAADALFPSPAATAASPQRSPAGIADRSGTASTTSCSACASDCG